jgi:hypothetical protein
VLVLCFDDDVAVAGAGATGACVDAEGVEAVAVVDVLVVEVGLVVGHNAPTTPPLRTIPNRVLSLTVTVEQAVLTAPAIVLSAASHALEQLFSKSVVVHDGIWLSYAIMQGIGIKGEVTSWKFARESAVVRGKT